MNAKTSFAIGVAYGHCRTWLENFGQEHEIPVEILAFRVAELLGNLGQRPSDNLSSVPRKTSRPSNLRKPKMALAERPSRRAQEKIACPECSNLFAPTGMFPHLVGTHAYTKSQASSWLKERKNNEVLSGLSRGVKRA